jgi:hypothetical protein
LITNQLFSQLYSTQTGETNFFTETPVENISAVNKTVGILKHGYQRNSGGMKNNFDFRTN